jgi:Ras-related GTP-binding protein A/B
LNDTEAIRKILIVGLDQAGKTSILNILNQKYNLMDDLKPTIGIERSEIKILGISIISWDLGGQERFREEYLKNLKIFEKTDTLMFVIDVLHATRYEEALEYYSNILAIFDKVEIKPKVVLLFHKVDPNLIDEPETLEMLTEVKELFLAKSEDYSPTIFLTSIFDRKSIIDAFSKSLQEIISELKPFKKILESIVLLLKLDASIVFDENLMILSDFYKTKDIEDFCLNTVYNSAYYILNTNPKLAENFTPNFELVLNIKNQEKIFSFMDLKFRGWNLYLLAMGNEKVDPVKVLSRFNSMSHLFGKD